MTIETPYEAGRANATMALDQAHEYGGLINALHAFIENAFAGLETDADRNEAERGFVAVLTENNITIRPWIASQNDAALAAAQKAWDDEKTAYAGLSY